MKIFKKFPSACALIPDINKQKNPKNLIQFWHEGKKYNFDHMMKNMKKKITK